MSRKTLDYSSLEISEEVCLPARSPRLPMTYQLLTAAHTTRVCFDRPGGAAEVSAHFGCVACGELLCWDAEEACWACLDCGQELFPDEAILLLDRSALALARLRNNLGGRKSWLRRLFRRLLRLGP